MSGRALGIAVVAALTALALAPQGADSRPPLSHEGRWLTDRDGRVVFLHGFNMVYKVGSYRPAETGFSRNDARFLRRHGFNTIRLGIIYKGLEPEPPAADGSRRYRDAYLESIARTERILARQRIFTLLDFHQDLYNERFQGEGWPDWQVLDDGVPSEPQQGFPANYLVNAGLQRAFDNFWANAQVAGRGLQDHYAAGWRHVAQRFRDRRYVAGYDLLNEPWPGSAYPTCSSNVGCPAFDAGPLSEFSIRVIERIREVDRSTLAFYEPLLTFDFGAATSHRDTGDANAGFSFHNYCLPAGTGTGSAPEETCEPLEEMVFDNADDHVARTGDVPFLTEFGASDDLVDTERVLRMADDHMVSWQYWHYCDCDDPTTAGPGVQSLVIDPAKPPRGENLKRAKLRVLERPYPQAVAGTPLEFGFEPDTGRFELRYSVAAPDGERLARRLRTEVYVPPIHYPDGYRVAVRGGRVTSEPGARHLTLRRNRGAGRVALELTPR